MPVSKTKPRKCSKCDQQARIGQCYCRDHHAEYMREWRPKYSELTPAQRRKSLVRNYARFAERGGRILRQECEQCGSESVHRHHEDYDRPLDVVWLCAACHLKAHGGAFHGEQPPAEGL